MPSDEKATIAGVTGQDGAYLVRLLLGKGAAETYEWFRCELDADKRRSVGSGG